MDILILGNGFDLAHGLNTKYSNFLEYCVKQLQEPAVYKPTNPFFTNMWIRHFLNIQNNLGENWIDLEKEIYNVIKHISKLSFMMSQDCYRSFAIYFDDIRFNFYRFDDYAKEDDFGRYEAGGKGYKRYGEHNNLIYEIYFSNSKGVINFLYDQLREFTKLFECYLLNEVMASLQDKPKFKLSLKSAGVSKGNKDVHVLSFNYTDTCKRLYDQKFNTYCDVNIEPVYVHGEAKHDENDNLVLGTLSFQNRQPNHINFDISTDFNVFKKHNQRHRYGTIEPYQDLLLKIKKSRSVPTFYIIGHSLDDADHNILKHILLSNSDSKINIYYHNEEALIRMQNNIDLIIGEDEVMAKVRFIKQDDPERGILIPQKTNRLQPI